jgi:hypothetical protein
VPDSGANPLGCHQQVQHIIGMPLQLIIIGMPQSPIIFIIKAQQFFIMSMFMPAIGMTLHIMQSDITVHSMTHFIDGIGMPIIGIGIIMLAIGMAMLAGDMHIMLMLPQCIIIGMPIIGIIGMLAFIGIGICMAFIMVVFPISSRVGQADGADSKDWPKPHKMAIEQQE